VLAKYIFKILFLERRLGREMAKIDRNTGASDNIQQFFQLNDTL